MALSRRDPPWHSWMKSSTNTSVCARGFLRGRLDGGASSNGSGGSVVGAGVPRANARSARVSSSSRGRGAGSEEVSSIGAASSSRR